MTPVWTLDFETMPIGPRPDHCPPEPVGLAVRAPGGESRYLAWGHPSGNNCAREDALGVLRSAWDSGIPILCHNAKFDLSICYEKFGLPQLPWDRVHDTMFLAFLLDPYARTLGLKQLADVWLGMPPEERNTVDEWVLANKDRLPRFPFIKNSKGEPNAAPTKKSAGAWIGFAPAELVGPYAIGDVERTWRLFQTMHPAVIRAGMGEAYDVERQILPILMENERIGLRVDVDTLRKDVSVYTTWFNYIEEALRVRLNSGGLNFDSDEDVADALERCGIVTEFAQTATGKRSVSKNNLRPEQFNDPQVAQALGWRNRAKTCLKMFMEPWLEQAERRGGVISCDWNQVASPDGGTRTGRPSTRNPNFLNISKDFEDKGDGYAHPDFIAGLPKLPLVRRYILPDEGHVLNGRDFQGQELRVFAHFEQGDLMRQFQANPSLDVHAYVGGKITEMTGQDLGRGKIKILNFQAIYGGGIPAAQAAMRCTYDEARRFKAFHDSALPGRKILSDTLSGILRSGMAVRTHAGRLYVRETPKMVDGRMRDFDYRMLNYMVQGSAADVTKRAILNAVNHPDYNSRFLLNVYDELVFSSPAEDAMRQSLVMKEAMESVPLRVALLTDPEQGPNWGEMKEFKDA